MHSTCEAFEHERGRQRAGASNSHSAAHQTWASHGSAEHTKRRPSRYCLAFSPIPSLSHFLLLMNKTLSFTALLAAALLAVGTSQASPLHRLESRDSEAIPPNYVGFPEEWAALQANLQAASAERRSPAGPANSQQTDVAKVRGLVPEGFCRAWLQGALPARPTDTAHATSTTLTSTTLTNVLPTTRTIVDTTSTSFSTSIQVVKELTTLSETQVIDTLLVIPETSTTSETLTLSFTETSTPLSTLSVPTSTVTLSPVVSTSTSFTTTTRILLPGAPMPRAPRRPAKPDNVVSYSDETVTEACLIKLYGVASFSVVSTTVTDLLGKCMRWLDAPHSKAHLSFLAATSTTVETQLSEPTVDVHTSESTFVEVLSTTTLTIPSE